MKIYSIDNNAFDTDMNKITIIELGLSPSVLWNIENSDDSKKLKFASDFIECYKMFREKYEN